MIYTWRFPVNELRTRMVVDVLRRQQCDGPQKLVKSSAGSMSFDFPTRSTGGGLPSGVECLEAKRLGCCKCLHVTIDVRRHKHINQSKAAFATETTADYRSTSRSSTVLLSEPVYRHRDPAPRMKASKERPFVALQKAAVTPISSARYEPTRELFMSV
jgi:hypothetical protein